MSLSIGIVGLPNVGKSTLFNALTASSVLAANYPFATIEPNTGIVPVPDTRLAVLQKMYGAAKLIPATVTFVDIAGLVAGASTGEGLGNKFLANIRECDAIVHVVRAFSGDDIQHVNSDVNPVDDIAVINTELILADLQTIDNHLPKLQKEARHDSDITRQVSLLEQIKSKLDAGTSVLGSGLVDGDENEATFAACGLGLLSAKPVIYVFNVDEQTLTSSVKKQQLAKLASPAASVFVCAKLEEELKDLAKDEAGELLASYGASESGLAQLAVAAYQTLGLQSYLTAGPKEVRAWTIHAGDTAPQAAGVIHTDFEKGFIAAQIVDYDELVLAGSEQAAKAAGKMRLEGKTYIMRPGDVVEFRFNT